MKPGTILHDIKFRFSDGETGNKLLVLLTPLVDSYYYIAAKTTSKEKYKNRNTGCQHADKHPNFFIPTKTSPFKMDTWISLNEFYEIKSTDLIQRHFAGEVKTIGNLENVLTTKLLNCVLKSEDITLHQELKIKESLEQLNQ